jgi:ABC-type spermidine/putrescine transport system permease subunit I
MWVYVVILWPLSRPLYVNGPLLFFVLVLSYVALADMVGDVPEALAA